MTSVTGPVLCPISHSSLTQLMLSLSGCMLLFFSVAQTKPVLALHRMTMRYRWQEGRLRLLIHVVPIFYPQASIFLSISSSILLPSPYSLLTVFQISNMTTGGKLVVQENEDSLPSPNTDSISQDVHSVSGCLI